MKHFIKAQAKLLVTVLTLVVVLGIGATVAYLQDTTGVLNNTFEMAELNTRIEETVDTNGTKNVVIANTGKSNAYVRARIMVSGIASGNVEITDDPNATKESAREGKILLVMPNAGSGESWQRVAEPGTYSDDWYYFCKELPGTNTEQKPESRKTDALLAKVFFGANVDANEITITITHESVLAIPGGKELPADIKGVFDKHK